MSAPFLIYTFHCLRGKRRVSAALREITCYLQYHEPKVAQCTALARGPAPWPGDNCLSGADTPE
jgi:hypothetical protein